MTGSDPGWYPDPDDASRARYWDGSAWTDRTRDRVTGEQPPGQVDPAPRPWWRGPLPIVVAGAVAVIAVLLFVVLGGSDDAGAEVILQPAASSGTDPFTESVARTSVKVKAGGYKALPGTSQDIRAVNGAAPGLYGGTGQKAVCDPAAMVAFLKRNPDKAAAFASVVGISPSQIPKYLSSLTPVLLREDTRVTNHGFVDGKANAIQSVLEAGTAVMVDRRGVPRIRCACGNPLSKPVATTSSPTYSGDKWGGFDDQRLVAISPARRNIETFKLVNVHTGRLYRQPAGSGGMTVQRLLNSPIPIRMCRVATVPFRNGVHPQSGTSSGPGGALLFIEVTGMREGKPEAVVGDLNGDGANEGVVSITEGCGGNAAFPSTYVFGADGKVITRLPAVTGAGGDFDASQSHLRIVNGGIEADVTGYAASDAHCCPSIHKHVRYELNGSRVQAVPSG